MCSGSKARFGFFQRAGRVARISINHRYSAFSEFLDGGRVVLDDEVRDVILLQDASTSRPTRPYPAISLWSIERRAHFLSYEECVSSGVTSPYRCT
jgi:hypothetical protein